MQLSAPIADYSKQRGKHAVGERFARKWKEPCLYPLNKIMIVRFGTECCCTSSLSLAGAGQRAQQCCRFESVDHVLD